MPTISVIMPAYNAERYLYDSASSILNQTFSDLELLIYNDASTDGSDAILRKIAARDSRVKIFSGDQNLGQARALNFLIDKSPSPLVAIQDADDISMPERLSHQVQYLQSRPQVALLGTEAFKVDEDGNLGGRKTRNHSLSHIKWHLLFDNAFIHTSVVARREALIEAGGYQNLECSQDFDLWSRIIFNNRQAANLPDPLVLLRVHPASKSRQSRTAEIQVKIASQIAYGNYRNWIKGRLTYEEYLTIIQVFQRKVGSTRGYLRGLLLYSFLMFELVLKTKSVSYAFCAYPKK